MCPNICESTRDKNTMKAMIQIPHLELIFLQNAGRKSFIFYFFCTTKTPGWAKKIKIIINKSNFIFIPDLEKLG